MFNIKRAYGLSYYAVAGLFVKVGRIDAYAACRKYDDCGMRLFFRG